MDCRRVGLFVCIAMAMLSQHGWTMGGRTDDPSGYGGIPLGEFPLEDGGDALFEHIIEQRGRPVTSVETRHVLYARDFGAVPDNGKDDLPALRRMIAEAVARGKTKMVLEPGVYNLLSAEDDTYALELRRGEDLILEGNGAELLHGNPKSGFFRLTQCKRVILRNFTTDYDPPPFTQGVIVGVDPEMRTFDLRVDPGYPLADDTFFEGRDQIFGFLMDRRPEFRGRMKPGATHSVRVNVPQVRSGIPVGVQTGERRDTVPVLGPEVIDERTVRLQTIDRRIRHFEEGDLYVQLARSNATQWVLHHDCEDITFQNLTIHATGAAVFIGTVANRINILDCQVVPRGDRLIAANGGGAIAQAHVQGIWVEGCRFQSISDDPVNFYSKPIFITAEAGDGGFHLWGATPDRLAVGDEVAFFDVTEGRTSFVSTVARLENQTAWFDPPVDPSLLTLLGDPSERNSNVLKQYDYLMNLRLQSDYYVVRNNEFINCRGRVLLRSSRGMVEGNTVIGSAMGGLVIENDWVCPEGYRVTDTVIRNNRFEEFGLTVDDHGANSILFVRYPREGDPFQAPSGSREHQNLLISGNTFANWVREPAFTISGISGLQMVRNTFLRDPGHPYAATSPIHAVIEIEHADGVRIRENTDRSGAKRLVSSGVHVEWEDEGMALPRGD